MPRNTKRNIQNFEEWTHSVIRRLADTGENLEDLCNRPHKFFFLSYDQFKCNITNPKYYLFVQDAILKRLIELNDIDYINELRAIQKDKHHYDKSKIVQVEEELDAIWDDTFELLTFSHSICTLYEQYKPKSPKMPKVFYSDLKQRNFKMDYFGIANINAGWLEWDKLINEIINSGTIHASNMRNDSFQRSNGVPMITFDDDIGMNVQNKDIRQCRIIQLDTIHRHNSHLMMRFPDDDTIDCAGNNLIDVTNANITNVVTPNV